MTPETIKKILNARISDIDRLMEDLYYQRDDNLKKIKQEATQTEDRTRLSTSKRLELIEKEIRDIKELLKFGSIEELLNICEEEED